MEASSSCAVHPKSNRLELHFSSCRRPWLVLARRRAGTGANSATKLETPLANPPPSQAYVLTDRLSDAAAIVSSSRPRRAITLGFAAPSYVRDWR
jgi:hypothetical protein